MDMHMLSHMHMETQSPDVIRLCLLMLNPRDVLSCMSVCRAWSAAGSDDHLWMALLDRDCKHSAISCTSNWREHVLRAYVNVPKHRVAKSYWHSDEVLDISFSPDGLSLATASRDGCVAVWSLNTKRACPLHLIHQLEPFADHTATTVRWSPNSRNIMVSSSCPDSDQIAIFDTCSGEYLTRLRTKPDIDGEWLSDILILKGDELEYISQESRMQKIGIWNIGSCVQGVSAEAMRTTSVNITFNDRSNFGHFYRVCSQNNLYSTKLTFLSGDNPVAAHQLIWVRIPAIAILHRTNNCPVLRFTIGGVTAPNDSDEIFVYEADGFIAGYDLVPSVDQAVCSVRPFTASGAYSEYDTITGELPVLCEEMEIRVVDLVKGTVIARFSGGNARSLISCAFCIQLGVALDETGNVSFAASGDEDGRIIVYDAKLGLCSNQITEHSSTTTCVRFNPRVPGVLVSVSDDTSISVFVSDNVRDW